MMLGDFLLVLVSAGFLMFSAAKEPAPAAARPTAESAPVELSEKLLDVPTVSRLDHAAGIHGKFVDIGDASLYVQDVGKGAPVVLLNGGPGNTLHAFHPEMVEIGQFARVIFYDRRGQGLSTWRPGNGYTMEQALDDLNALRQALDIESWTLLGHSWGGVLALVHARRHPDSTDGVVLVDALTGMRGPDASDNQHVFDFMSAAERKRTREIYTSGGNVVADHRDGMDLAALQRNVFNAYMNGDWRRQYHDKPDIARMAQIALFEWVHDKNYNRDMAKDTAGYDLTGAFRESGLPILILEGRKSPVWGTWESNRLGALREEFPNARVVVFEESAHYPYRSEKKKFLRELEAYVRALQAGAASR